MLQPLYPLLLEPTLHVKVWGGRKLQTLLHKQLPAGSPYGESWEVHDTSIIANGPLAGQTLAGLLPRAGADLIGDHFNPADGMPLLIKLLDATQWLSVQVHPNDQQAIALEGDPRGKTEAWIILDAEPGAQLVIGVQPGTSQEEMAAAIRAGTLEGLLQFATVQTGDVLYMPANTVHAIGPGIVLYEVQQSSNVTYRLYDWGRMGLDGKPRELHVEKGVQVSNLDTLPHVEHPHGELLVAGDYFQTVRHILRGDPVSVTTAGYFHTITCIAGEVSITHAAASIGLRIGQSAFIPAALGTYQLGGNGTVLRSSMI